MRQDFWHECWQTGRIAFHDPEGDPLLPGRWAALQPPARSRVLVTLCGKSRDMAWLAGQGHAVVGVELSAIAARAFFEESGLPFAIGPHGPFQAYRSTRPERDLTILVGDFFDLDPCLLGEVHAVYDRAATIALPPELRARHAAHLATLVPPAALMLLISIVYDQSRISGPPFSLPDDDVRALYSPGFAVELLSEVSGSAIAGRLRERGLETVTERAYRLRRRD